jgi:hypothetical protein
VLPDSESTRAALNISADGCRVVRVGCCIPYERPPARNVTAQLPSCANNAPNFPRLPSRGRSAAARRHPARNALGWVVTPLQGDASAEKRDGPILHMLRLPGNGSLADPGWPATSFYLCPADFPPMAAFWKSARSCRAFPELGRGRTQQRAAEASRTYLMTRRRRGASEMSRRR